MPSLKLSAGSAGPSLAQAPPSLFSFLTPAATGWLAGDRRRLSASALLRRSPAQAALERRHEIEHRRRRDLFWLDREAFHLRLDQLAQRFLVTVPESGGIEAAAAALDDRLGDRHHVEVDFRVASFESGRSYLLRGAQGDQHHARAARLDHHRPLPPA